MADPARSAEPGFEIPVQTALAVVRQRREHWRVTYFQQESRAQFLAGLLTAAGAALLGSVGPHVLIHPLLPLFVVAPGMLLLLAAGLTLLLFVPLHGYRFSRLAAVEQFVTFLALLGRRHREWSARPDTDEALARFAEAVILHEPIAAPAGAEERWLLRTELSNAWAQWLVAERKAGLLRASIFVAVVALPLVGAAWIWLEQVKPIDRIELVERSG